MRLKEITVEKVHGSTVRYLESGEGKSIILISGWLGTAENFIPIIEPLSENFRCIALDLPGLGKSTAFKDQPHTLRNYSEFLDNFIEKLALKDPVLVGVSLGASLLLSFSALSRNPPRKIIVQLPIYKPIKIDTKGKIQLWILENVKPFTLILLKLCRYKFFHQLIYFFGDKNIRSISFGNLTKYGPRSISHYSFKALVESINDVLTINLEPIISKISNHVLLIYGSEENLFSREYEENLADRISQCDFRIIPGGTHCLVLQKPEIFAKLISSFVDKRI